MPSHQSLLLPPFTFEVRTDIPLVVDNLKRLYGSRLVDMASYPDYFVSVQKAEGIRRFYRPQARFFADQQEPFQPLQQQQAYAMLEWGMNWCVATHEMQYVIIHAAVLAKDNKAILFPAPPGSGKSTLTTWLAFHGWRLLSDEMALIQPHSRTVIPFVRPICLKNNSITLAKQWFPDAIYSTVASDTHKGDVIHLSPPESSWQQNKEPAEIVGVVFPNYRSDTELDIYKLDKTQSFMQLAQNAFNYGVIGNDGFVTLCQLIDRVAGFEIFYNDLALVAEFLQQELIDAGR
ncbi:HprK-related kinase A [Alkalimonas amylolytica]|uniref:HprK-related kinase A n=1 Tax=Alkalimonas amylolytica TaxID=152573 RepID=A0A1H4CEF2_ALKAM|nr:HprK-related kinase A [Alkalimonas amylolytica]SEA58718.1 HprK-related kinase A [Alkalimonas amylolytica]